MATRTERALADVATAATEADAEVATFHLRRRLRSLAPSEELAAFGRIDDATDRWYVGRRHIEDDAGDPLVVDWRAPVSVPFYRATVHDPLGLERRRRFTADGAVLVDVLEEDFNDPEAAARSGGIPDPLLAELDRERSGQMRDIVATIAAEQDEVIRTPLDRLLVVQGGPGTGKTAVALHRAAYLLFEHRLTLVDAGVLVIGPNPVFLHYVADVLPSLGEVAVRQTTIAGLRPPSMRIGADDPDDVGRVKGDPRMAAVVAAALRSLIRLPDEPVSIGTAWGSVRFDPADVAAAVEEVTARGVPHSTGKEAIRNLLLHRAYEHHERVAEVPALKANFVAAARSDAGVKRYLDRLWPVPPAAALVQDLMGRPALRRRATAGMLDDDEAELIARPVTKRIADERWSEADVVLVDEAEAQINGVRTTYGHVVVDEAQDLSTMALRMLARRSAGGSMTVVGDLAQGTRPWAQASWDDVVTVLQGDATATFAELTVGYRTPAPMLDLANRLLPLAAPGVAPARSVRLSGSEPDFVATDDAGLDSRAADAAITGTTGRGTVAIVAVGDRHAGLAAALDRRGVTWRPDVADAGEVALLTPLLAKGLEFDHVVVCDPAEIIDAEPAGHRALFVALTRATRTLTIVHARPIPELLAAEGP